MPPTAFNQPALYISFHESTPDQQAVEKEEFPTSAVSRCFHLSDVRTFQFAVIFFLRRAIEIFTHTRLHIHTHVYVFVYARVRICMYTHSLEKLKS